MGSNPPYTITEKAADYLAKIAETVTRLEFGTGFKRDIKLHRENRVRTIYSSLAIEGNALSLGEVAAVIEGKIVAGAQSDVKEVRNAFDAYDKIMTFDPYSIGDFLEAHKLMTNGLVKESGKFRSGDVGVFDGHKAVHIGARPQYVPGLVEDLFRWAKKSELHPVLKSAILHYEIETIHPFEDGNGRIGRLWQTLMLAKWNELFAWIPMESILYENRQQYYTAIEDARKANDSGVFIEFTLSAIAEIITEQAKRQGEDIDSGKDKIQHNASNPNRDHVYDPVNDPVNDLVNDLVNLTQRSLLDALISNRAATYEQLANTVGISTSSVKRNLRKLCELELIERVGSDKTGHWIVKHGNLGGRR